MWLVETTRSRQLTEATHDELLSVEIRGFTGATLSHPGGAQQDHSRWIETEEMQSPSVIAFNPIEEGAMTVVQQTLPEEAAMTVRDEALTHQRDRPQLNVAPE